VSESTPKTLPLGCFPTLTVKVRVGDATVEKKVRLCDLDRLFEGVIDRPDMVLICAFATDGPEVNTPEMWAAEQALVRKWMGKAPRSTAVLAGLDSRGDQVVVRILRQHHMQHISMADAVYQARHHAFHAYGEFSLTPLRSNLLRFLEQCLMFHMLRLSGADTA
jgi:hypothetical protein